MMIVVAIIIIIIIIIEIIRVIIKILMIIIIIIKITIMAMSQKHRIQNFVRVSLVTSQPSRINENIVSGYLKLQSCQLMRMTPKPTIALPRKSYCY